MEEISEVLGWAALVIFGLVVGLGLLLRFGKLKKERKLASMFHRVLTVLALVVALVHYLMAEERSLLLVLLSLGLVAVPILTIVLKRMKKLAWAINLKMVLVPLLALGLFWGHLGLGDSDNRGHEHEQAEEYED